uniref:Uncharacterized protein n=1 Tax=viral metagenome TaxID=1070528 RepID=A0A6M3XTL2_9ZZZZ
MPDDEKITEQDDLEKDEALAFNSDDADESTEGLDVENEFELEDKKPEEPGKKPEPDDKENELVKKPGDAEEDDGEVEDEDEDLERGKEILAEQERAEKERIQREATQRQHRQETGAYNPRAEVNTPESIEFFKNVVPQNLFPETVTLKDGTELDFASVINHEPELPVMMAVIANNIVRQMIHSGFLSTRTDIDVLDRRVQDRLFARTVTNKQDGVPEAAKIYHDPEFKKWFDKEPKEIQALQGSDDPYDHIKLFNRYLNKSGLEAAGKKVADLDEKRKAKKKSFDAIHKTTVRNKKASPGSMVDPMEEMREGFESEDDDDDLYI